MKKITYSIQKKDISWRELSQQIKSRDAKLPSAERSLQAVINGYEKKKKEINGQYEVQISLLDKRNYPPKRKEIEIEKIRLEEKQKLLNLSIQWEENINKAEDQLEKAKISNDEEIKIPFSADYYTVIIEDNIFSTTEWCDIRVKRNDSVEPLSQWGTYIIFDGRLEIRFQSNSPRDLIRNSGYDGCDTYYEYKQVNSPEGLELVIYTT